MRKLQKRLMECKIGVYFFTVILKYDCFPVTLRQNYFFRFLEAFAYSRKAPISFVMSFCPFARLALDGFPSSFISGIFVRKKNLLRKFKFGSRRTNIRGTLYRDPSTFYCCLRHIFVIKTFFCAQLNFLYL